MDKSDTRSPKDPLTLFSKHNPVHIAAQLGSPETGLRDWMAFAHRSRMQFLGGTLLGMIFVSMMG